MTIRDRIFEIQNKLALGIVQVTEATEMLNQLSALYGNVLDEVQKRELAYNAILLMFLDSEAKANRAKIKAQVSPEYQSLVEAQNTEKLTLQMIRSLNRFIDQKKEEARTAKYL